MAKYGSPDLTIVVNNKDLSQYLLENIELSIEGLTEEGHGFGEAWVKHLYTGIMQGNEFTLSGLYDDTAQSGTDAILGAVGTEVPVVITWGDSKTSSFTALIKSYSRTAARGELHKITAVLLPTGAVTES